MAEGRNWSEDATNRGQDWEIVSLTASTYAAAPGPKKPEEEAAIEWKEKLKAEEGFESLLLSQHFAVSTSSHQTVHTPNKCDLNVKSCDLSYKTDDADPIMSKFDSNDPPVEACRKNACKNSNELDRIIGYESAKPFVQGLGDSDGNNCKVDLTESSENAKHLDWIDPCHHPVKMDETKISFLASKLDMIDDKTESASGSKSTIANEGSILRELQKEVQGELARFSKDSFCIEEGDLEHKEIGADITQAKEKVNKENGLPTRGLWKHYVATLVSQAKQANTLWPITITGALVGLVILGQRWQNQQLNSQNNAKNEKISRILYQIARLKEVVGGNRKVPIIKGSS
eukprot:TRINITY_DN2172_c0_g1_i1.p1 TRINITY_DN2172_c0_g1~~TRINITY_DN2172_c0_g1_i1.p1  ORF type:complete len:344 (+),score=71.12 TRINITY_DN2172_c0_g1_i1:100-1131(+)